MPLHYVCLLELFNRFVHLFNALMSLVAVNELYFLNHRSYAELTFFRMNKNRMPFVRRIATQKKNSTIIARTRELFHFLFIYSCSFHFFYWIKRFMMVILVPISQKKAQAQICCDHSFLFKWDFFCADKILAKFDGQNYWILKLNVSI